MSANAADVSGGEPSREKQNSNSEQVVFDSKNIGKKPKAEYFVKVEGAEARKKAAIKEMQKEREKAEKKNRRIARSEKLKTFLGKHKVISLIVCAAVVVSCVAIVIYFINNPPLSKEEKSSMESVEKIEASSLSCKEKLGEMESSEQYSTEDILDWGETTAAEAEDVHDKFACYMDLATFAVNEEGYENKAIEYAHALEELAQDDGERYFAYKTLSGAYGLAGDIEKCRYYYDKMNEVDDAYKRATEELDG